MRRTEYSAAAAGAESIRACRSPYGTRLHCGKGENCCPRGLKKKEIIAAGAVGTFMVYALHDHSTDPVTGTPLVGAGAGRTGTFSANEFSSGLCYYLSRKFANSARMPSRHILTATYPPARHPPSGAEGITVILDVFSTSAMVDNLILNGVGIRIVDVAHLVLDKILPVRSRFWFAASVGRTEPGFAFQCKFLREK